MHKSQILLFTAVGFLAGILALSVFKFFYLWLWQIMASSALCFFIAQKTFQNTKVFIISLSVGCLLLGFSLGIWRLGLSLAEENQYQSWIGSKQDFQGLVVAEADKRQGKQLITVRPQGFKQNILLTVPSSRSYRYGDQVWVRGKVAEAKAFDDFDYPGFLAKNNVYALMSYPKVIVLRADQGTVIIGHIFKLKEYLSEQIASLYPKNEAGLLLGLLLGAKRGLSPELTEQFRATGTSHIMAVSGFNISIFISGLSILAFYFGRRWSAFLGSLLIAVFVIMVGPTGSVVRAALMGYTVILAMQAGRLYLPLHGLLLAATIMCVQNPRLVFWDVGFQLSLAATLGIVVCYPLFQGRLKTGMLQFLLAQMVVTFSATLFTLPISLWQFGQWSLVGPLVNVIIAPLITPAMILGGLSLLPLLGAGFAFVNTIILSLLLFIVSVFSNFTWSLQTFQLTGWQALSLLVMIVFGSWLMNKKLST